jgi:two-component system chemotaxis response regulator CheY
MLTMTDKSFTQSLPYLVVDDSGIQRQALCKLLYGLGITDVVQAENGLEAIEVLNLNPIELIISDLEMRTMNGYELLKTIRGNEKFCKLPFIIASSTETEDSGLQAILTLADANIKKPIDPEQLVLAIEKALGKNTKLSAGAIDFDVGIIIIDDVSSARKVARKYLSQLGFYNLKEAKSAKDAIKEIEKGKIGLILTDWSMPEINGIELIKILKSSDTTKNIPVIMISAFSERARVLEAAEAGAISFISKPYPQQLLYDHIVEANLLTKTKKPLSDTQ